MRFILVAALASAPLSIDALAVHSAKHSLAHASDEADTEAHMEKVCGRVSCHWTARWNCPDQFRGSQGRAKNDGGKSYNCCCTRKKWKKDEIKPAKVRRALRRAKRQELAAKATSVRKSVSSSEHQDSFVRKIGLSSGHKDFLPWQVDDNEVDANFGPQDAAMDSAEDALLRLGDDNLLEDTEEDEDDYDLDDEDEKSEDERSPKSQSEVPFEKAAEEKEEEDSSENVPEEDVPKKPQEEVSLKKEGTDESSDMAVDSFVDTLLDTDREEANEEDPEEKVPASSVIVSDPTAVDTDDLDEEDSPGETSASVQAADVSKPSEQAIDDDGDELVEGEYEGDITDDEEETSISKVAADSQNGAAAETDDDGEDDGSGYGFDDNTYGTGSYEDTADDNTYEEEEEVEHDEDYVEAMEEAKADGALVPNDDIVKQATPEQAFADIQKEADRIPAKKTKGERRVVSKERREKRQKPADGAIGSGLGSFADWQSWSELIFLRDKRFAFCALPKSACTSWKQMLLRIVGSPHWKTTNSKLIHDPQLSGLPLVGVQKGGHSRDPKMQNSSEFAELIEMGKEQTVLRAVIVRDPTTRLLSTYLDRCVDMHEWQRCFSDKEIDFGELISRLEVKKQQGEKIADVHIKAQSDMCGMQFMDYEMIGHMENYAEDSRTILEAANLWEEYGQSGWGADGKQAFGMKAEDTSNHKGSHLTDWQVCTYYTPELLQRVQELYKRDFTAFGYSVDPWLQLCDSAWTSNSTAAPPQPVQSLIARDASVQAKPSEEKHKHTKPHGPH